MLKFYRVFFFDCATLSEEIPEETSKTSSEGYKRKIHQTNITWLELLLFPTVLS
jgi:hypothetical protein